MTSSTYNAIKLLAFSPSGERLGVCFGREFWGGICISPSSELRILLANHDIACDGMPYFVLTTGWRGRMACPSVVLGMSGSYELRGVA